MWKVLHKSNTSNIWPFWMASQESQTKITFSQCNFAKISHKWNSNSICTFKKKNKNKKTTLQNFFFSVNGGTGMKRSGKVFFKNTPSLTKANHIYYCIDAPERTAKAGGKYRYGNHIKVWFQPYMFLKPWITYQSILAEWLSTNNPTLQTRSLH